MDETHKVAVTRLGDRIRVGGTAELAGYTLTPARGAAQDAGARRQRPLPDGGDVGRAEFWCGLRPMTPDGTPVIGATPIGNLFLATGHGTLGWTMAAGTGRVMADVISGRSAGIDSRRPDDRALSRRGAPGLSGRGVALVEIVSPLAGSVVAITVEAGAQRRARRAASPSSSR